MQKPSVLEDETHLHAIHASYHSFSQMDVEMECFKAERVTYLPESLKPLHHAEG